MTPQINGRYYYTAAPRDCIVYIGIKNNCHEFALASDPYRKPHFIFLQSYLNLIKTEDEFLIEQIK
mgnify:CR=1 FL=1|tara:strand:- start:217 stop:414 length:198 start_codon:yes stop_codon:yes gene_type:complete